jgi:hypothetical protein
MVASKAWRVEPETASVVHVPTGLRVHFAQDPEDEHAWDGRPVFCPPELLARAAHDGGKELARLMREAGDAYNDYLRKVRQ